MRTKRLTMRGSWVLLVGLAGGFLVWPTRAEAEVEARCSELGANCVCSERFNVATYQKASGINYWQPSDSATNTKPCWVDGVTNYPIATDMDMTNAGVNSGNAFATLPVGHSVSYVMQMPMDYDGSIFYGNTRHFQVALGS